MAEASSLEKLTALKDVYQAASVVQEYDDKTKMKGGAEQIGFGEVPYQKIMEDNTSAALIKGVDELDILTAIHAGTEDGHEKAKHIPEINKFKVFLKFIMSRLSKISRK